MPVSVSDSILVLACAVYWLMSWDANTRVVIVAADMLFSGYLFQVIIMVVAQPSALALLNFLLYSSLL